MSLCGKQDPLARVVDIMTVLQPRSATLVLPTVCFFLFWMS